MTDSKPDFGKGVSAEALQDGPIAGVFEDESIILVRSGGRICAVSGECTHAGAPLETGLVADGEIRCPWHHARFSLATGQAVGAPALEPLSCFAVEEENGGVRVTGRVHPKLERPKQREGSIVIVGGGAAGFACADMLARAGAGGRVTLLMADVDEPYDRTLCSKEYLAGEMGRDDCRMPTPGLGLGPKPEIRQGVEVASIDPVARAVKTADGEHIGYDVLVLATGAEPIMPDFAGSDGETVHLLRTLADADALIEAAETARTVAILGSSFIGLEAAASMVARKLDVTVIAQDDVPLGAVLGKDAGRHVQSLHEEKGVRFRLGRKVGSYDGISVTLDDGNMVPADMLIVGAGVRPRISLAKAAGVTLAEGEDGVAVDGRLETSSPGVYAIGDIASYPDQRLGHAVRVEHWVHAQRQGQHLARLLLGETNAPFGDTPFFWSGHYDASIHYVGHAATPDVERVEGSIPDGDFALYLREGGKVQALVTLERDMQSLEVEAAWDAVS